MPAGLILVLVVGALLVAMVLNADATLRKSDAKGDSWRNDVAQRIADVSAPSSSRGSGRGRLRPRQEPGHRHRRRGAAAPARRRDRPEGQSDGDPATVDTVPAPTLPVIAPPTPQAPLRFWVGGDSITQTFGTSVQRVVQSTGVMTPTLDYRVSTGLARPDYFNWPEHFLKNLHANDPLVMVVMFGANDGQGTTGTDGKVYSRGTPSGRGVPPSEWQPRWTSSRIPTTTVS